MINAKVIVKRVISPDGRIVAEARSVAIASGDNESIISQDVTVKISSSSSLSSSFSSSSVSRTAISR